LRVTAQAWLDWLEKGRAGLLRAWLDMDSLDIQDGPGEGRAGRFRANTAYLSVSAAINHARYCDGKLVTAGRLRWCRIR